MGIRIVGDTRYCVSTELYTINKCFSTLTPSKTSKNRSLTNKNDTLKHIYKYKNEN